MAPGKEIRKRQLARKSTGIPGVGRRLRDGEPDHKVQRVESEAASDFWDNTPSTSRQQTGGSRTSSSQASGGLVDLTKDTSDDEYGSDSELSEEWIQIDGIETSIVGVQYYHGMVLNHEKVLLRREPSNPYDSNAIRVDNMRGEQVGHIPRTVAAWLAPELDTGSIVIDGETAGNPGTYQVPLYISIGAPVSDAESTLARMYSSRAAYRTQRAPPPRSKQNRPVLPDVNRQWLNLLSQAKETGRSQTQQLMEKLTVSEADIAALPTTIQPARVTTRLLPYQLQGLRWMLDQEHPRKPDEKKGNQFWIIRKGAGGNTYWYNQLTGFGSTKAPAFVRGGILADDMGLGKTLQAISLIFSNPNGTGLVAHPMNASSEYSNATLVVCPLTLVGNWADQLQDHCDIMDPPNVYIYHGAERKNNVNYLLKHDVVITTYDVVRAELGTGALFKTKWRRVILDEGHAIRNRKTKQSMACFKLNAERRWILTGTPIQNSVNDMYSSMRFLKFGPLDEIDYWNQCLNRPLQYGDPIAVSRIKLIIKTLVLRRTKETKIDGRPILALPPLRSFIHQVGIEGDAKAKYKSFERLARDIMINSSEDNVLASYEYLLSLLTRLRQCCDHHTLAKPAPFFNAATNPDEKPANISDEEYRKLMEILAMHLEANEDCCICLETLSDVVITPCKHVFDKECITNVLTKQRQACPMCRAALTIRHLLVLPPPKEKEGTNDLVETQVEAKDESISSCPKIDALIEYLQAANTRDQTSKSVVFSQWTGFLDIIGHHLKRHNIAYVRLDGKMVRSKREAALRAFATDPDIKVFLVSLQCGALGLNLTAANQCFILDPWWNPSIEDQAVDRIYRLGQTRPVSIIRFVTANTIEDKVVALQEKKRKMVAEAFGERARTNAQQSAFLISFLFMMKRIQWLGLISLAISCTAGSTFKKSYPALLQVPPTDALDVKEWLSHIDMTVVPDIPVTKVDRGGNPKLPFTAPPTILQYPELAKRACAAGHQIAVHTWSHKYSTSLTNEQFVAEVKYTEQAIQEVCGVTPRYFRPPYGDIDNRIRALLKQMGYITVILDLDTNDWMMAPGWIKAAPTDKQGHICLEHELYQKTVNAAIKNLPMVQRTWKVMPVYQCVGDDHPYREDINATSSHESSFAMASHSVILSKPAEEVVSASAFTADATSQTGGYRYQASDYLVFGGDGHSLLRMDVNMS
ncbi:hypothetical protein BZG36_00421 [Bifiguratus adelaidae]|uniref:Uncharacterized protein n=1 Tax=Bifiguratus adelaidae TaxID=1938954 RepID=A0A261Y8H8_9FUNG|nr:hypothetical protein BZG36_00421 [Bifiguratus adelaidae]